MDCRRLDWFHIGGQAWFVFFVPGFELKIDQLAELNQSFPIKEALSHYRKRSTAWNGLRRRFGIG